MRASEIELVKKENGTWVSGIDTPECLDALNWAQDMIYGSGKDYIYPQTVDTYQAEKAFLDQNAVLLLIHSYFIFQPKSQIAYGMEDFGLLPFPLSDNNTSNNWIGQHETLMYGISIPANAEEPESAAYVLNALYEPLPGYETEEQRLDYYNRNIFHDPRDADVFFKTLERNRYTYRYSNTGFLPNSITQGLSDLKGKKTVKEYLDSIKTKFESTFDVIIPMYESMESVWGAEE
jgi:ABC-type glycerol-3-phosphate transport system substrate-binding protein